MTTEALVSFIKAHALAHYEDGGWDVIVECWDDQDIITELGGAETEAEALQAFDFLISILADRQSDARNSAF
jgi:hypothetical protein